VNDAMLAHYGAVRERFIGRTPADFYAHDLATGRRHWADFFDVGQATYETDERREDGSPVRIEGEYICLHTPDGRIAGHFGVQRDATARYRALEALRDSEARYEAAFRLSPFRLTINRLDDGRFLEVNDAFLADLRRTRDEVIGRTSVELGLWADPAMREQYIRRLKRDGTITDLEFSGYERDGRREITQLSSTIVELRGVPCVLTIAHDVTERRLAEAEAAGSQRQLRALASRQQQTREDERRAVAREIHDELGQLLTGVKLDVAWVRAHLGPVSSRVADRMDAALDRIASAMDVVRRIATELRPAVLDDLGLVAALEWQVAQFTTLTGVQATSDFPDAEPPLPSEARTAVFRIVQEALTNVARHAGATAVHVALAYDATTLRVVVQDDGRGITIKELSNPHSLGLVGLRERALNAGGTLTIDGTPGGGTRVGLVLPLGGAAS
ncbi:MAG: PAS domain S-box protein, partial [Gemmatimonadaceae bacterium]|nr:PAS domain S-box protein [Gemmatimonadaceae bacterium]